MKITWLKESKKGIRCGILGCIGKPVWECPVCGAWYCEGHKSVHFHRVQSKRDGELWTFNNLTEEELKTAKKEFELNTLKAASQKLGIPIEKLELK